ncbi:MAG: glycosyltransferase family 2 protein [Armatimonadota bacterium]|nr:glycosyltransferase family 2 protein [Armatimonadota bacterium]
MEALENVPLVSIVTPTYNRAHTLPRLWNSIRQQTLRCFEWIVVDDGSRDNTAKLVRQWMEEDPRVVYVAHAQNQGVNAARDTGTRRARAPYLVFIDSDDTFYEPCSLELMYNEIRNSPENVGAVWFSTVREDGQPVSYVGSERLQLCYEDVVCAKGIEGEFIGICRRPYVECAPWSPYRGLEALHHWARARHYSTVYMQKVARIYYSDAGDRLISTASILRRAQEMYEGMVCLLQEHGDVLKRHCRRRLYEHYFYVSLYAALSGREKEALSYAARALLGGACRAKSVAVMLSCILPHFWRGKMLHWWNMLRRKG